MGAETFRIQNEEFDTGGSSSTPARVENLFSFQCWYCELCGETNGGNREQFC